MKKSFDKTTWLEEKELKLAQAKAALEDGLKNLKTSDDWKRMLEGMAKLGKLSTMRLSFNNQMLIWAQRPGASNAATFKTWLDHKRSVKKGEKGMAILAPVFSRKDKQAKPTDDETKLVGFRVLTVFAEEQTEGEPLPKVETPSIQGPEAFEGSVQKLREVALGIPGQPVSGIELRERRAGDLAGARGWYSPLTKQIVVLSDGRSQAEQFSTLVHEVAHALLHPLDDMHGRAEREVEAESTAYVVCHALGLDAGAKSFPYVGSWAQGDDALKMVSRSGQRIATAATRILDAMCGAVEKEEERVAA